MRICRRSFGVSLLGGLAAPALAVAPRPKLLVLVVLEQFRPDYLDAVVTQLSPGGFRRLFDRGASFPDCRHLASSFSASAIATLATGAWPAQHGIVADSWYDRAAKRPVSASEEVLRATTLAAQIVGTHTHVSVVSMEPAHAGLFAGTDEASLYWMGANSQFEARGESPDWLAAYNSQNSPEAQHGRKWMAMGAQPDAPPLRVLNFNEERPQEFQALYRASPLAQAAQFDFALELINRDKLGSGPAGSFDFLCIISGAMARLGSETGGRSQLMTQMTLQLDKSLDEFLSQLAKAPGEGNFSVVLVGAHGAPPEPSEGARPRMAVKGETVAETVERGLAANGMGHVEKYLYPFLYLDSSGFRDPEQIRIAAARAAMEHPAVSGYYTAGDACSTHDEWKRRFRQSFHPQRSGDVMLSYRPEYVEDFGQGRGVSYGSLYNYDVRVPLCFYGPQFRAGVYERPVELVDVAATLARVCAVAPPSSSEGRVLGEALV